LRYIFIIFNDFKTPSAVLFHLQPENYMRLLNSIIDCTKQLTDNECLEDIAETIKIKYMFLFEKLSLSIKAINRARTTTEHDQCETIIMELAQYYKEKFNNSFTPKFHILLKHVIPFLRKTGIPLGLMAEQGGEQMHAIFNKLKRRLAGIQNVNGMPPELALLKACMEEHLIQVYPANRKFSREE
jgi:hypothetical protein